MTERPAAQTARSAGFYRIGGSSIAWEDGALVLRIAERGAPVPYAVTGEIRLAPAIMPATAFALDPEARHWWQPVAPAARITVDLDAPRLRWTGTAYHDANWGDEPLESGFTGWTWSRTHDGDSAAVLYDARRRDGGTTALACRFGADGGAMAFEAPPMHALPGTLWRVGRAIRSEEPPHLCATLEDAPFYTRSLAETTLDGARLRTFHESLALDRFAATWVRLLLPFRMPRALF